jgi:hypothetical protein
MAMYQSQNRVCIEFLKSSKGFSGRIIKLNYGPNALPPQLVGRMDMNMWSAFMQECATLAERHPYVIKPKASQVGSWALCFSIAAVIGCASINPDGGSYPQWEAEASQMLERWRGSFGHYGLALSLQRTREHWIQIDIVGPPPMGPPPQMMGGPPKEGYEYQKQLEAPDQPSGYQPPPYQQQQAQQPLYQQPQQGQGQLWGQPQQQQQGFQPQAYQQQHQQPSYGQPGYQQQSY